MALILMPLGIPLALWGGWNTIQSAPTTLLKVLVAVVIAAGTYLGAALLLWFNRYMQTKWRKHGVIK
ncbi:MAG: hypothetical protein Q4G35_02445 [Propionibacteriaceae bacterium]|nr:hypothetical protein [Propionibacteriaceae bacterium]